MGLALPLAMVMLAFTLGACPFSVWIGRWLLQKSITDYGDGNPGAWNVFRAGGREAGWLALILDAGKGIPFVALSASYFGLSEAAVFGVGISAILGHAFSPFLRFRGGKAIAVTYGVMIVLPRREILLLMAAFMLLGFLIFEVHAWVTVLGPLGSLAFLGLSGGAGIDKFFLLSILLIFVAKNYQDLKGSPGLKGALFHWLNALRRSS